MSLPLAKDAKVAIRNALGLPPDLAADPMLARRRARGDMEVWVPVRVNIYIYMLYTYERMVDEDGMGFGIRSEASWPDWAKKP